MNSPQFSPIELIYQAPVLLLVVTGLLAVLAEAFFHGKQHSHLTGLAVAGSLSAAVAGWFLYRSIPDAQGASVTLMYGMLVADRFAAFFIVLISLATAVTALVSGRFQREHNWENGEYYGLLLLVASGMGYLVMASDLVTVFLGIEIMSLGVYVLVASRRRSLRGSEAAMKYFLMGAFASAFLLYGIALIYGATGTTNLAAIKESMEAVMGSGRFGLLIVGEFLLVISLAFKVAAVPFHMWAPDAYEGAPTPITGFMAAAVKAATFAVMLRLFGDVFGSDNLVFGQAGWAYPLALIAALTMTVGNIAALRQENIKRMLAYSSISHAGVVLVGIIATGLGEQAVSQPAVVYYLAAYSVTTLGAFAVVAWVGSRGRERVLLDDWAGLAAQHPGAALAMTVFMLSLGGIPPTAGFFGKFYVFKSAVEAGGQSLMWLVVIGVVNSAISVYYYLRVVMAMYFREAEGEFTPTRSGAITLVLIVCVVAVFEMGIMPGFWLRLASGG